MRSIPANAGLGQAGSWLSRAYRWWIAAEPERCTVCGLKPDTVSYVLVLGWVGRRSRVATCPRDTLGIVWLSSYEKVEL